MALTPEELAKQQLEMRRIEEYAKAIGLSYEKIAELQDQILSDSTKTAENLKAQARAMRDSLKVYEKYEARTAQVRIDTSDMAKALLSTSKAQIKTYKDALKLQEDEAQLAFEKGALTQTELDALQAMVAEERGLLNTIETLNNKAPYLAETFKEISDSAKKIQSGIDNVFDNIPGGGFLKKALGIDDISEQIDTGLNNAMNAFIDNEGDVGAAMEAFGGSVNMAGLALAGVVLAIKGLWDLMSKLNEEASAYAEATGLTVGQAGALVQKSYELQASLANELASREDILAVQKDIAKEFKGIVQLSDATVLSLANMSANLDYASETAGQVQAALMSLGGTESASLEAQQLAANLADAAGLAPGPVMEDIAQNAKLSSKYFGNNVKALARAAAEGAKLGLSLDQMVKLSDSLLDIESSLSNQFEYMALTGKEVNFDLARQLALQGDIAGAAESIINEMGGLPDDPLALQAAADAAGLSVEELQKVYATSANINGLSDEDKANRKAAAEEAAKMAEQQQEMTVQLEKIASIFTSAILPVVKVFGDILSGAATAIGYIADGLAVSLPLIGAIAVAMGILYRKALWTAIAATWKTAMESASGLGPMGIFAGLAAGALGIGALYSYLQKPAPAGDMFSPADGRTQISTKEGGLFQLSKNDDVIAAPGLASAMAGGGTTSGGGMDTSRLEGLMETLITKIDEVSNRTANIIINDRVVDEIKMSADIISTYKVGRK